MGEVALQGVSAAPGVAVSSAVVLDHRGAQDAVTVPDAQRRDEAALAREALRQVAGDLEAIAGELRDAGRRDEAEIVEAGVLMALDPELTARVEVLVSEGGLRAADALREAADKAALELTQLGDPTLALRADDVRSVGRRASARAAGSTKSEGGGILVARTLGPADVAELAGHAKGIALAGGGVTSHAAIVARSLGVPMVIGLGDGLLDVEDGDELVIDGDRGFVVLRPDAERARDARDHTAKARAARAVAIARRAEPAITRDGRRVHVLANASTTAELEEAMRQGAEGIGLLRTELLFLEASAWPTVQQQVSVLRPVLGRLAGQTATVRLFDFGGDKTPPFLRGIKSRGIEVLLDAPDMLRLHLAAVIEAGAETALRVLVPMVTTPDQVRVVRQVVGTAALTGAMIETPEAARGAPAIAAMSDFLSIGTNDLTQLVMGQNREQSRSAPVLDGRVLALVGETMRAARAAGIPVDVCGEAASDPKAMPIMVGLGVDELSVAPARVGQVRQWVRELDYAACAKEAELLLDEARDTRRERV